MSEPAKVVYTAKTHTTGGRDGGASRSSDGHLEVKLTTPGTAGAGTNPEQLFAAAWGGCYQSALMAVARKSGDDVSGSTVKVEVAQGRDSAGGFGLAAKFSVASTSAPRRATRWVITC